jgi:HK97 family phage prohead protease
MDNNKEKRFVTGSIEIEQRDGAESRTISGYAVVFDKFSSILGGKTFGFREKITRAAFDGVDMSGVIATFNHNFDNVLARTDSGSLSLTMDDVGLRYSFESPNTSYGNDLLENVRNGNVKGSSFMFTVRDQMWEYKNGEGTDEREITQVDELFELGPVTVPAYPDTTAAQRSYNDNKPNLNTSDGYESVKRRIEILKTKFT